MQSILDRRPAPPIPVFIITGFLGSGKTTLLNRLLRDPSLADSMVLINEFGEIGLDHLLIEKIDGDMILMQSGCLCCTIRGDLIATLEDLLRRLDNGRIKPFHRLIIETTGLADPAPILHTFISHPYFILRYQLQGIITLIDAVNGLANLGRHPEALKQAAVADRLVLSKTDLSSEPLALDQLRTRLSTLNPGAGIVEAANASAENLLDVGLFDPLTKQPVVARWLNAEAVAQAKQGEGDHHHHHNPNRHDANIRAWSLRSDDPIAPGALDLFLELLRGAHGPNLLRVKGIVALSDDPQRPLIIHGAQHLFHPPVRLAAWPSADQSTRIVFILLDLEPFFIQRMWEAFLGIPSIDQADQASLQENPLSVAPGGLLR